ncbi:MAG: efflux RND transporter periplasmic adaptor subunit [Pyrinomonadaceae bacterium]
MEQFEENETETTHKEAQPKQGKKLLNKRIVIITIAGVILFCLAIWGILRFGFSKRGGGEVVSAPRNMQLNTDSGSNLFAEEQTITLTDDQLKAAALQVVEVGETLDGVSASAATTGTVRANDYKKTPVITQVSGVVSSVNAELGSYVRRGQTVATISSKELADEQGRYLTVKAQLDETEKRYRRALDLAKISEESRNELDRSTAEYKSLQAKQSEASANAERMRKLWEIGARSKRDLEVAESELKQVDANLDDANNRLKRAKQLLEIDPARKNEIDQFATAVRSKESELASARSRLNVLGISNARISSLKSASQISPNLSIVSPVSGVVTERIANVNEVVKADGKLAEVTDLSNVWVIGQVYEKDIAKLTVGSGASITSDAFPNELFRGQISYIDPMIDERTRTAQVRVELPNPGEKLKLGMYVSVGFARLGGSERTVPLIPQEAVQKMGNTDYVFVATDTPNTFIVKPVKVGDLKDEYFPVLEGIFVGDRVVTTGSFLLRAEWLKTHKS